MEHAGQIIGTVFIFCAAMAAVILRIWVKHQERMAEIASRSGISQGESEVARLRSDVTELKELLHQQIIAMDSMHRDSTIKERLEQKN